jgi:hypothetical protein
MDMETVLPIKTVSDIVKELREGTGGEVTPEKQCGCGVCNCSSDI